MTRTVVREEARLVRRCRVLLARRKAEAERMGVDLYSASDLPVEALRQTLLQQPVCWLCREPWEPATVEIVYPSPPARCLNTIKQDCWLVTCGRCAALMGNALDAEEARRLLAVVNTFEGSARQDVLRRLGVRRKRKAARQRPCW